MDASFEQQETNQLVITPELLAIMQHIVDKYPHKLKQLMALAYQTHDRREVEAVRESSLGQAQSNILEFLGLMEFLLDEVGREHELTSNMQHQLMPSIQHIDTSACDGEVVNASVEQATNKIKQNPRSNPQEVLYKELLKRWKPAKKSSPN